MRTDTSPAQRIALITDDLTICELVSDAHSGLRDQGARFPDVDRFAGMGLVTYSSTEKARTACLDLEPARAALGLIVLDGAVRAKSIGGTTGSSVAAMALLDLLTHTVPDVPVVVLVSTPVEGLELRQVRRSQGNIRSLDLSDENLPLAFAKALSGVSGGDSTAHQRITVRVGEYAAQYLVTEGANVKASGEYEYRSLMDLHHLLDSISNYSPISEGRVAGNWRAMLDKFGEEVFRLFINETIGPFIIDQYQTSKRDRAPIELRFDIEIGNYEAARLFELPFELARPPEYGSDFLCTRVPMARRIRFMKHAPHEASANSGRAAEQTWQAEILTELESSEYRDARNANPGPGQQERPLRLLFINASFEGTATVFNETTGAQTIAHLTELAKKTADELKVVKEFATLKAGRKLESVSSVSVSPRIRTAAQFRRKIEDLVSSEKFDILHFSGHSINLPGDEGTFLVLPGESGQAEGVSVRKVASWVEQAGIRMVVLSSCGGSSLRTSIEMMRSGAEAVLGFRWDVDDHARVEYLRIFYQMYLQKNMSVAQAYCEACNEVRLSHFGLPIWASAVAVVRD
ncbi:CHAT domain-containing protein [Caballeronia sordidicola]|uniref:CHAT domain-containing protein n=1 Tax=Caballeronia sordidicola TaxID=196367 RepID=UPI0004D03CFC|nr:CHAT domain-containing protein [Caballeronia sordidicola]